MDLAYSEDQILLRETGTRFLVDQAARSGATPGALDAGASWREFADLGWIGLPIPSEYGGLDGDAVDVSILMELFGRHLVVSPYFSTVLLGSRLLMQAGKESQRHRLLSAVVQGEAQLAVAYLDLDPAAPTVATAVPGQGWRLTGEKRLVLGGPSADWLIVSAVCADTGSLLLFVLPAEVGERRDFEILGGGRASDISFDGLQVSEADRLDGCDAGEALEATLDEAAVALSFDTLGSAEDLLVRSVQHAKAREQFGKPIFDFQAVRHQIADMVVACEEARAISLRGALECDSGRRSRAASAAKWKSVSAARFVAERAIQIHGAMGMSEELPVGRQYRRILANDILLGGAEAHLKRYALLSAFEADPADSDQCS